MESVSQMLPAMVAGIDESMREAMSGGMKNKGPDQQANVDPPLGDVDPNEERDSPRYRSAVRELYVSILADSNFQVGSHAEPLGMIAILHRALTHFAGTVDQISELDNLFDGIMHSAGKTRFTEQMPTQANRIMLYNSLGQVLANPSNVAAAPYTKLTAQMSTKGY